MNSYTRVLYFLCILMCSTTNLVSGEKRCVEGDRIALLQFKKGLDDDPYFLKSWNNNTDCCQWRGVGCDNTTGRVVKLNYFGASGELDSSLLSLSSLRELNLTGSSFTRIPEFIGSFKKLQHLDLSWIALTSSSKFPYQLGNLSALQTLDLSGTFVSIQNTRWLSHLSSLKYLQLNGIDLSFSIGLLDTALKLPSLVELHLCDCFHIGYSTISFLNPVTNLSDSVSVLDLSFNQFQSSNIYPWLFNFSGSLTDINLSGNYLQGAIPEAFGTITNLNTLNLSNNRHKGGIPSSFRNLSGLRELHLPQNNLEQDLPSLFDNLSAKSLQVLDLYSNYLTGSLPDFTTFMALTELHLAVNKLNGSFPKNSIKIQIF